LSWKPLRCNWSPQFSDIEYGQGALPENSFFDRLTLEIAVWPKVTAPA